MYFGRHGIDGAYELMQGKTVAEILGEFVDEQSAVIASGEVNGMQYRVYDAPEHCKAREEESPNSK